MKSKDRPYIFEVAWNTPYTQPPDGKPRVLLAVVKIQSSGHPIPDEIEAKMNEVGYGHGYSVFVGLDPVYTEAERKRRQLTPEQKKARSVKKIIREAKQKAPLFAEEFIQVEMKRKGHA